MKIDFRKIEIEDINGNVSVIDLSKELGNLIYKNTPDLGELEFAQELYKNGEVDIDGPKAEIIRKYVDRSGVLAFVKIAIERALIL
jgi:hypothetical protein